MDLLDNNLWSKLDDQLVTHIIEYLNIFEKRKIGKWYYDYANNKKNFIWKWFKYHSLRLEMENELLDNINAIRAYYKLKTPLSIKVHIIFELYDPSILKDYSIKTINNIFNKSVNQLTITELLNFYPM